MFYSIDGLCPNREIGMGGYGFNIKLWPAFKEAVAFSGLTQDRVDGAINSLGKEWLVCCGWDSLAKGYRPTSAIRVSWGEWGPEHITVPGNACGLDIDRCPLGAPPGGQVLVPHNVDCWNQVNLLLIVFCWLAETLVLCEQSGEPIASES